MADTLHELSGAEQEARMLNTWLKDGKPELGWRGDARLRLGIGVLEASKNGIEPRTGRYHRKGDVVARRYEVIRHCEDGTDQLVCSVSADKPYDLIPKLISCDPRTPGFTPVEERLLAAEVARERDHSRQFRDVYGAMTEHLWSIVQERDHGRLTHRQVGGSDERPDRNLAKDE